MSVRKFRRRGVGDAAPELSVERALRIIDEKRTEALDILETALRRRCPHNAASVLEDMIDKNDFQFLLEDFDGYSARVRSGALIPERGVELTEQALTFVEQRGESYVERVADRRTPYMQRCFLKKPFKMRARLAKPSPSKAFEKETEELCGGWNRSKLKPPTSCEDIEYAVRPTWNGVDIFAYANGRASDIVGRIELQLAPGNELEVHYSRANPTYAACNTGRTLYEVARQYGCENGLRLVSDVTRSPYSECFWRRQVLKGRAECKPRSGSGSVFPVDTRDEYPDESYAKDALAPYKSEVMQSYLRRDAWTCGRYRMKDACPPFEDRSLRGIKKGEFAALVAKIPSVAEMRKRGARKPKKRKSR